MSGLKAYAQEVAGQETVKEVVKHPDYVGPAVLATTSATSTADEGEDFVTTWFSSFTTLV